MVSRWLPYAAITERLVVVLAAGALFAALWRGADYLALPQSGGMSIVENALPIRHWGALLICGVLLTLLGYVLHRWPVTIIGHALLGGMFAALGIGEIASGISDIAGDSLRTGVALLCVQAVLHAELMVVAWQRWDAARG